MTSELKPCPFCGGQAKAVYRNGNHQVICATNGIECSKLKACYNSTPGRNGDSGKCDHCFSNNIDCRFALESWNTRDQAAAMIAARDKELSDCLIIAFKQAVAWQNKALELEAKFAIRDKQVAENETLDRLRELHKVEHAKLGEMLLDKSDQGYRASNWQGGKVNGIATAISAYELLKRDLS